jgi:hypothetical protein
MVLEEREDSAARLPDALSSSLTHRFEIGTRKPSHRVPGEPLVYAIAIVAEVDDDDFHLMDDRLCQQTIEGAIRAVSVFAEDNDGG